MKKVLYYFLLFLLFLPGLVLADPFEKNASYTVCFTPGDDCTQKIVDAINDAVSDIWVQAYSFTSRPIAKALVTAKNRGVNVKVIFDKDIQDQGRTTLNNFNRAGIPIWIDQQPAIAHNKVIILDQTRVVTGSFNFTRAAQEKNAENVLIIDDAGLAQKYLQNWQQRQKVSVDYKGDANPGSSNTLTMQDDWLTELWNWIVNLLRHFF